MATTNLSQKHPFDEGVYSSDALKKVTLDDGTRVVTSPKTDIKRPICAGIDVHKSILMAAVCITDKVTLTKPLVPARVSRGSCSGAHF